MEKHLTNRYLTKDINTDEISLKTLKKIEEFSKKFTIQPDPIHFNLIYELILQQDSELVKEINGLIENNNYDHNTAQILFTNLWARIIQRHMPYEEFSTILEELLSNINEWASKSSKNNATLSNQIATTQAISQPEEALLHIQDKIIPLLKESENESRELQNNVGDIINEVNTLKKELNKANILARTDELTNLPNKRGFNEFLKEAVHANNNNNTNISLVAFDIDFFKSINDEFGHLVGDSVLKYLAKIFKNATKNLDFIARVGGEEFMLILQNTDISIAKNLAESIRSKVEASNLHIKRTNQSIKLTVSAGISHYKDNEEIDDFIDRADKALYSSKNSGRNKVTTEDEL